MKWLALLAVVFGAGDSRVTRDVSQWFINEEGCRHYVRLVTKANAPHMVYGGCISEEDAEDPRKRQQILKIFHTRHIQNDEKHKTQSV